MDKSPQIIAPWTKEQVETLNKYQTGGYFHPYTCPKEHPTKHPDSSKELVATAGGWWCPVCNYFQDWAWQASLDIVAGQEAVVATKKYEEARDRLLITVAPLLDVVGEDLNTVMGYIDRIIEERNNAEKWARDLALENLKLKEGASHD